MNIQQIPVHRSGLLSYRRCRRQWWLQYAAQPSQLEPDAPPAPGHQGGITKREVAMALSTGSSFHLGAEHLCRICLTTSPTAEQVIEAMDLAGQDLLTRAAAGFHDAASEYWEYYKQEQYHLTRALVFVFAYRVLPMLLQQYRFTAVESELSTPLGTGGLLLQGRIDATGETADGAFPVLFSWKTAASFSDNDIARARTDDQGLSESYLRSKVDGHSVYAVHMVHMVKGQRRKDKDGVKRVSNVLVRPYQDPKSGELFTDYAAGKGGRRPVPIWEVSPHSHIGWLTHLLLTAPDVLDKFWASPGITPRTIAEAKEWVVGCEADMTTAWMNADLPKHLDDPLLQVLYPKERESCFTFGGTCQYAAICHESMRQPLSSGTYLLREPHHPDPNQEEE